MQGNKKFIKRMETCSQILAECGPLSANALRRELVSRGEPDLDPSKPLEMLWIFSLINKEPGPRNSRIYTHKYRFNHLNVDEIDCSEKTARNRFDMAACLRDLADYLEYTIPDRYFDED